MATHAQGRAALRSAWVQLFRAEPSLVELQIVGAISAAESGYGDGVYRLLDHKTEAVLAEHRGTNNWGAIQCCIPDASGACPANTFLATDKSPSKRTPENPKGFYDVCFRAFATPADGALQYLKTLLTGSRTVVREALRSGSATTVARLMRETRYHETEIPVYAKAIQTNAAAIAATLREPLQVSLPEASSPGPGPGPRPGAPPGRQGDGGGLALLAVGAAVIYYFRPRRRP